jgi:serine/threonine-protein kinase
MGSVHYMSPEQIRSMKRADARSDVWALGAILYRLLSGRRPFEGEGIPATCARILTDTPEPLSTSRSDVPPALEAVVRRCLEKDPARRIQSVTGLARGLAPFGSPRATLSLESIVRLLPDAPLEARPPASAALAAPAPWRPPPASAATGKGAPDAAISAPSGAWGTTGPVQRSRGILPAVLITAAVTICAAIVAWGVYGRLTATDGPPPAPATEAAVAPVAPSASGAHDSEAEPGVEGRPDGYGPAAEDNVAPPAPASASAPPDAGPPGSTATSAASASKPPASTAARVVPASTAAKAPAPASPRDVFGAKR